MSAPIFSNYVESGSFLMTGGDSRIRGSFTLTGVSVAVANSIRVAVQTLTRSVGLSSTPTIRKNTSIMFNEMLAHRISMLPLAVRKIDSFDPSEYECVLNVSNSSREPLRPIAGKSSTLHVTASDFRVFKKQSDGSFQDIGLSASSALFPPDPITNSTCLILKLRSQWNQEKPTEEVDLTAYPIVGTRKDHVALSPVCQCSYSNTLDMNEERRGQFFRDWLKSHKKIDDPSEITEEQLSYFKREWLTLDHQRCFLIDQFGEPYSFDFTIESIGIRSVPEIVAEAFQALIKLLEPYADPTKNFEDLNVQIVPTSNRMQNGRDLLFKDQDHLLGNLLQSIMSKIFMDDSTTAIESHLSFVGYKMPHPLEKVMLLRVAFHDDVEITNDAIRLLISKAASYLRELFGNFSLSWNSIVTLESLPVRSAKMSL